MRVVVRQGFYCTFNGIPAGCIDCAIAQSQSEEKEEEDDRSVRHNFAFSIFRFAELLVNLI